MIAAPLSIAAHVGVLLALLWAHVDAPASGEEGPVTTASLVQGITLDDPPKASATQTQKATPVKTKPQRSHVRRSPTPPEEDLLEADEEPVPELTAAEVASAATAESGGGGPGGTGAGAGGGHECNMTRLLQNALRKDHSVQSAVADAHRMSGKPMLVWNGDWVRSTGQDGKGLAMLREAIAWEVAFAPPACRTQPMHGLVLISLNDAPGGPRLVMGGGAWRWTDMLNVRSAARE